MNQTREQMQECAAYVERLFDEIRPILAGQPPELQGAVLMQLLGMWLAGHPRSVRDEVLKYHLRSARIMAEVYEREMFGDKGHPSDRLDG